MKGSDFSIKHAFDCKSTAGVRDLIMLSSLDELQVRDQHLRPLKLILIRHRKAEMGTTLTWHLLAGYRPEIIWWPRERVQSKRDRKRFRETGSGHGKKTNEVDILQLEWFIMKIKCEMTPSSRSHHTKRRREKPAVPMRQRSRGLWERSRSSKRHKGTPSFFSQLGKNCCEPRVLRDGVSRPSTSRTLRVHQEWDRCCQHKKRRQRSLNQASAPLLLRVCTKITVRAHAPPDLCR